MRHPAVDTLCSFVSDIQQLSNNNNNNKKRPLNLDINLRNLRLCDFVCLLASHCYSIAFAVAASQSNTHRYSRVMSTITVYNTHFFFWLHTNDLQQKKKRFVSLFEKIFRVIHIQHIGAAQSILVVVLVNFKQNIKITIEMSKYHGFGRKSPSVWTMSNSNDDAIYGDRPNTNMWWTWLKTQFLAK